MNQEIRFCSSYDDTKLAYGVYCDGDGLPCVRIGAWFVTEELNWHPMGFRFITENLAPGRCLYSYDRRGTGGSQRDISSVSMEHQIADLAAVVDHAGLERFDVAAWLDGCAVAISYAARYPERVEKLALQLPMSLGEEAWRNQAAASLIDLTKTNWPLARRTISDIYHPYASADERQALRSTLDSAVSADVAAKYLGFVSTYDVRSDLEKVRAPTLVIALRPQGSHSMAAVSTVAAGIPGSKLITDEPSKSEVGATGLMRDFFGEGRATQRSSARVGTGLTVILFADIASSTALTERLGDSAFRDKARALDEALRGAITNVGGTAVEGKLLGDGVLAVFSSAREAIACAGACHTAANDADLQLHIGIHAGDVIREEGNVFGGAVNIAARVSDASGAGETFVSQTVRDLARTSAGVAFEDRGERQLKGVGEPVRLWAVRSA